MILIDGIKGTAAVAGVMWCGKARPRGSGVSQRRRLQRTSAPSHIYLGSVTTRMSGSEAGLRPATSISGGGNGLWPAAALLQTLPHCRRKIGNPRVEKALQRRSQMLFA